MTNLLVSVIMPVYNAEPYLNQALISILNQTYHNLEILIADDCSDDKSKVLIDTFTDSRITRFHNDQNLGYLKTCNKLFLEAKGDYIAFQDADDWSEPERIEKIIAEFTKKPSIALCGCNFIRINDITKKIISYSDYPSEHVQIVKYTNKNKQLPFCGASIILKRSIYDQIGGYREYFDRIGYEHFDWFMLIIEKFEVANISDKLYNYRFVKNSFSRTNKLYDFKKFYSSKIAWFLKEQRNQYGYDALQNNNVQNEFKDYLKTIESEFWNDRKGVYNSVIFQFLNNNEYYESLKIAINGLRKNEIGFMLFMYYMYRIFRSQIKSIIKS